MPILPQTERNPLQIGLIIDRHNNIEDILKQAKIPTAFHQHL